MATDAILAAYRARKSAPKDEAEAKPEPSAKPAPEPTTPEPEAKAPMPALEDPPSAAPDKKDPSEPVEAAKSDSLDEKSSGFVDPFAGPGEAKPIEVQKPPASNSEDEVVAALEAARARKAAQSQVPVPEPPVQDEAAEPEAEEPPVEEADETDLEPDLELELPALDEAPIEADHHPSLGALSPHVGLAEAIAVDPAVAPAGNHFARGTGIALVLLGGLAAIYDLRLVRDGAAPSNVAGLGLQLWHIGVLLLVLGIALYVAFLFFPDNRKLAMAFRDTQQEEFLAASDQVKMISFVGYAAVGCVVLGFLVLVGAYAVAPDSLLLPALAVGAILIILAAPLMILNAARGTVVRRLYVQSLILGHLEERGLGAAAPVGASLAGTDARVGTVLRALDQLLGDLPDESISEFMESEAAPQYLELLDELKDD